MPIDYFRTEVRSEGHKKVSEVGNIHENPMIDYCFDFCPEGCLFILLFLLLIKFWLVNNYINNILIIIVLYVMFLNLVTVKLTTRMHIHIAKWEQLPTLNNPQSSKPSPKAVSLTSHFESDSKS